MKPNFIGLSDGTYINTSFIVCMREIEGADGMRMNRVEIKLIDGSTHIVMGFIDNCWEVDKILEDSKSERNES